MALDNLRAFIAAIEAAGDLVRVDRAVSVDKEITEVADRCMKSPGGIDRVDERAQVIEWHGGGRRCRRSAARSGPRGIRHPRAAGRGRPGRENRAPTLAGRYRRPYVSTPRGRWRGARVESRRGTRRAAGPSAGS